MRKLSIFIALFFTLSLLLAACDTSDNVSPTPETNVPEMELTTTPAGVPTEQPETTIETTEIPETTQEVTDTPETMKENTETPVTTEPVSATEAVTAIQNVTGTSAFDPGLASNLLDLDIWNQDNEQIGTVDNMLVNLDTQQVEYLILEVGGILGIGGKQVAIPYKRLDYTAGATPEEAYIIHATRDELDNAPEFDSDALPDLGEAAGDYGFEYDKYWQSVAQSMPETSNTPTATQSSESNMMSDGAMHGVILASNLFDMDVYNKAGDDLADVQNLIIDPDTGETHYLVIEINGIEDLDGQWMLLPDDALSTDPQEDGLVITVDEQALAGAPVFEPDQIPDTTIDGWDEDISAYWDTQIQ